MSRPRRRSPEAPVGSSVRVATGEALGANVHHAGRRYAVLGEYGAMDSLLGTSHQAFRHCRQKQLSQDDDSDCVPTDGKPGERIATE